MNTDTRRACRGCGRGPLHRVLDLGRMPAADDFPLVTTPVDTDAVYPLAMELCGRCGLAQLAEDGTTPAEPKAVESLALRKQAADAVAHAAAAGWLRGGTVREFASPHGGSWLPLITARGFTPVEGAADVVVDCFGLMHEPDQRSAFAQRAIATRPGGVLLVQFHSLRAIVAGGQWNCLRHGHFAYYSMSALWTLLYSAGMSPVAAWEFDLYGGTVLVAAVHGFTQPQQSLRRVLSAEAHTLGAVRVADLQKAADRQARSLRGWLEAESAAGSTVCAYGAASRAVALFSLAGAHRGLVHAVADAAPAKQGRRMPGTAIPIIAPAELVAMRPDRVLLTLPDLLPEVSVSCPELDGTWVVDVDEPGAPDTEAEQRQGGAAV
ncbi:class I SAM-dependent methyltransferase [Nocardia cyriacigeorgica]|uniref:Transferase n=1 Tax=Nocardia cyriacigeorgica TaxID=135487 RepID=A0A5R8NMF1_9NOCA|nr:methyltransferase domain-containing protein [Nocardia cyriacigeorgica]TLF76825.1 transferase [Nocardia cyriacigeorgica]